MTEQTRRTAEEITAEVEKLKDLKPHVRPESLFGDDNHAAIDVQVAVLEQLLGYDQIYDRWEMDEHLLDHALIAREWMDGELMDGGSLAEGWEELRVD